MNKSILRKIDPWLLVILLITISFTIGYFIGRGSVTTVDEPTDVVVETTSEHTELPGSTPTIIITPTSEQDVATSESTSEPLQQLEQIAESSAGTPVSYPDSTPTGIMGHETDNMPVQRFSISTSNQTPPEDVLHEMAYHPGAGGGGPVCWGEIQHPSIADSPNSVELHESFRLDVCGWQPDEPINITIILPDGTSISQTKQAGNYGLYVYYDTDMNDSPGIYTFIFEGENAIVRHEVTIEMPAEPRLYLEDEGRMLFYNFQPNERIRLFRYEGQDKVLLNYELAAWQEFFVDSSGSLIVQVEDDVDFKNRYTVLGDISGAVVPHQKTLFFRNIKLGYIKMLTRDFAGFSLRECPDINCTQIGYYHHIYLRVAGQPREQEDCENPWQCFVWWPVVLPDGTNGWVGWVATSGTNINGDSPFDLNGTFDGDALTKFELFLDFASGTVRSWLVWPTETRVTCDEVEEATNDNKIEPYENTTLYDGSFYPARVGIPFSQNYRAVGLEDRPTGWAFRLDAVIEECPHLEILLNES